MEPKILHEGQHTGEFLVSEANGTLSREKGVLAQREARYLDGTILVRQTATGGDVLVDINDAEVGTGGLDVSDIAGVLYGNYDASASNVEAVVIARLAEVKEELIRLPEDTSDRADVLAALLTLFIRAR